ncbi:hypothetical protein GCM10010261_40200 [Streptomyces pilosus]|nr:hypothetical protein GCM10010261_40200 [Streptomyces pilosus]
MACTRIRGMVVRRLLSTLTYSTGRKYEDARSEARSAPTRQPSRSYGTVRTESGGTPQRYERSSVGSGPVSFGPARKAADVPGTVPTRPPRSPRTAHTEEAAS